MPATMEAARFTVMRSERDSKRVKDWCGRDTGLRNLKNNQEVFGVSKSGGQYQYPYSCGKAYYIAAWC